MNDLQENKQSMYKTVITVTDEHVADWTSIPGFVTAYNAFKSKNSEIDVLKLIQVTDSTGFAAEKDRKLNLMADKAVKVIGGLNAYAIAVSNDALREKINYPRSAITQARDMDAITYCTIVHDEAFNHETDIADYGVTPADVTDLKNALIDFTAIVQAPRAAIADKKAATDMLPAVFKAADEKLAIMDSIVNTLKETNTAFYEAYYVAREIVDLGRRKQPGDTDPPTPPSP